ncbi:hypothetical protein HDU85_004625 [Gaertneriomyces sp. JEL0708]|nr:hypothetical protein HDU85_004625 [Gaertneriomyces sp. JEL0708]
MLQQPFQQRRVVASDATVQMSVPGARPGNAPIRSSLNDRFHQIEMNRQKTAQAFVAGREANTAHRGLPRNLAGKSITSRIGPREGATGFSRGRAGAGPSHRHLGRNADAFLRQTHVGSFKRGAGPRGRGGRGERRGFANVGRTPGRGGRGGSHKIVGKGPSKEDLDKELDSFMLKDPKSATVRLDMELEEYMAQQAREAAQNATSMEE